MKTDLANGGFDHEMNALFHMILIKMIEIQAKKQIGLAKRIVFCCGLGHIVCN